MTRNRLDFERTPPPVLPEMHLVVVIRDDAPMRHLQRPPTLRHVVLELTPEQREALALRPTDYSGGHHHESVDSCWLEEVTND